MSRDGEDRNTLPYRPAAEAVRPASAWPAYVGVGLAVALFLPGAATLGAFWVTNEEMLVGIGLLVLVAVPFVGLAGLVLGIVTAVMAGNRPRGRRQPALAAGWASVAASVMLVLLAGVGVVAGLALLGRAEVRVVNRTGSAVADVRLVQGGETVRLGDLAAGASSSARFHPPGGGLDLAWTEPDGTTRRREVTGHFDGDSAYGGADFSIRPGGEATWD